MKVILSIITLSVMLSGCNLVADSQSTHEDLIIGESLKIDLIDRLGTSNILVEHEDGSSSHIYDFDGYQHAFTFKDGVLIYKEKLYEIDGEYISETLD